MCKMDEMRAKRVNICAFDAKIVEKRAKLTPSMTFIFRK